MALPTAALDLVLALEQAAKAVAVAGRTVAKESAGDFGALAVKSARLDFHFDLTVTGDRTARTVGLGFRNSLFGPTLATSTDRIESGNRGSITLDIVAVVPGPEAKAPAPGPVPAPPGLVRCDLGAFGDKLDTRRAALQGAAWPPEQVARVATLIDVAEQAAGAGDLKEAEAVLALLAEALAGQPPKPQPAPPKPAPKPRGLRPRGQGE